MENKDNNYNLIIEYNKNNNECVFYKKTQEIIYEDFDNKIPNEYYKLEELGLIKIKKISINKFINIINTINKNELNIKINYKSFYDSKDLNNTDKIIQFINNFLELDLLDFIL